MYKCKLCGKKYTDLSNLYNHIEDKHRDMIPVDMSVQQYYYFMKTGKSNGNCVMCKQPTSWNKNTNKYNRFCRNPKCKEKYVKIAKSRMIAKYGKVHLLNDPKKQREMLANRKISGKYRWSDSDKETIYTGSYELDFLKTLDGFFEWDPDDISMPSPHTYTYMYEGEEKFYIPDAFIHSLDLEIEIKDGGDNPNNHYKIQEVDKEKERLKDEVMTSQKMFHYIKLTNKNYTNFFNFLKEIKDSFEKYGDDKKIPRIFKIEDIKSNTTVIKESSHSLAEYLHSNGDEFDHLNDDIIESSKRDNKLFFLSNYNMDGKTLQPRVPNNFLTKNGYEDSTTKRVCFSTSIGKCLIALSQNVKGKEFYVHTPDPNAVLDIVKPTKQQVPDCGITGEVWVMNNVKLKSVCKIKVTDDGDNELVYTYGDDKKAVLYDWKYEVIEHISESCSKINGGFNTIEETSFFNKFINATLKDIEPFVNYVYDVKKDSPKQLKEYLSKIIKTAKSEEDIKVVETIVGKSGSYYYNLIKKRPDILEEYNDYIKWVNSELPQEIKERMKKIKKSKVVYESSISMSQINNYLQNEYDKELEKYLNDYKTFYHRMLKEKPEARSNLNEDIRRALIFIDGLAHKGVTNDLVHFAKTELGDLVEINKKDKSIKRTKESVTEESVNLELVDYSNLEDSSDTINIKLVYDQVNRPRVAFTLNDLDSKIEVAGRYTIKKEQFGVNYVITPGVVNHFDRRIIRYQVKFNTPVSIDNNMKDRMRENISTQINGIFNLDDSENKFIKEVCLKLFGKYPVECTRD